MSQAATSNPNAGYPRLVQEDTSEPEQIDTQRFEPSEAIIHELHIHCEKGYFWIWAVLTRNAERVHEILVPRTEVDRLVGRNRIDADRMIARSIDHVGLTDL